MSDDLFVPPDDESNLVPIDGGYEDLESEAEQYMATLVERIDNDAGYPTSPDSLDLLVSLFMRARSSWLRVAQILREKKCIRVVEQAVREEAKRRARDGRLSAIGRVLKNILPTAPVAEDVICPLGWEITRPGFDENGGASHKIFRLVERRRGDDIQVSRVPVALGYVVICSILSDGFEPFVELAWCGPGGDNWHRVTIPRRRLATTSSFCEEMSSRVGFPCHPANARDILEWLNDFEIANREAIPLRKASARTGWVDSGFMLGTKCIGADVEVCPPDAGDLELVEAFDCQAGSFAGWMEAVTPIAEYPRVELALYASLAPPVLNILGQPNFLVEWCGQTSTGKSTALSVAASCWGDPRPQANGSVVGGWGATKIAIERRMATLCDLPTILDETKLARRFGARGETIVPAVMYAAANGQADARGSVLGTQRVPRWRTVLLSTGEQRMVDFDMSAGTAARVITLWGSPFGGHVPEVIRDLERGLQANFGHMGRHFVQWLVANRVEWEFWREQLPRIQDEILPFLASSGDPSVANRIGKCLSLLEITARLVHRSVEMPWRLKSPVHRLASVVGGESSTAKRHVQALEIIASIMSANLAKMQNSPTAEKLEPHGGWYGWFPDSTPSKPWEYVAFHRSWLFKELDRIGYEPNAIIRHWKDAGWLRVQPGRTTHAVRVDDNVYQMICVLRTALGSVGFFSPDLPVQVSVPGAE